MLGSWVSLALPVTIFTLGIGMCEESVGDSGYGHENIFMHDLNHSMYAL